MKDEAEEDDKCQRSDDACLRKELKRQVGRPISRRVGQARGSWKAAPPHAEQRRTPESLNSQAVEYVAGFGRCVSFPLKKSVVNHPLQRRGSVGAVCDLRCVALS